MTLPTFSRLHGRASSTPVDKEVLISDLYQAISTTEP